MCFDPWIVFLSLSVIAVPMSEDVERIPQHRHCLLCGNAFASDGKYCSDTCMEVKKAELLKKKRKYLIIEGVFMAATIILILMWMPF